MGKRLLVQRRGRGGSVFRSPGWKKIGRVAYRKYDPKTYSTQVIRGKVVELLHDPGRGAPVARIRFEDSVEMLTIAPEGMAIGQEVFYGENAPPNLGNILPLKRIPEGSHICNVELRPGDGGKFARSSGTYAIVLAHVGDRTLVQLPSKKVKNIDSNARATIGIVAAGGRIEKPLLKAGKAYHMSRSKAYKYPTVRGKAMSPYAHPAGGGSHPKGLRPAPRNAPPGRKVGHIAPKSTGRRKGRKR